MISHCAQCQFFDHHPNHLGDVRCAIAPAYTAMWLKLRSLDQSTLNTIPIDSCRDFQLDSRLETKDISLSLSWKQWQQLIKDYDHPETILNALKDRVFEHSLSLTLGDWQAISHSSTDQTMLDILAQQGIESDEIDETWHDVDSSCIAEISFNRLHSCLYIRFHSQIVYEYRQFESELFQDFLDAPSKGQFFNTHIKNEFPYRHYA